LSILPGYGQGRKTGKLDLERIQGRCFAAEVEACLSLEGDMIKRKPFVGGDGQEEILERRLEPGVE
jgi:hypothetical protein